MSNEPISILKGLPIDDQKCLCFGYKTYCCKEDMEENREWHEVIFKFVLCSYKIKDKLPEDIEESILKEYKLEEVWELENDAPGFITGVTQWMPLPESPKGMKMSEGLFQDYKIAKGFRLD